ncbi:hypothetical protein [Flagellimonas meridianipacifica]|uniref:Uncharacterized protein n=1 Tax=Flagellimonas meridianipacifica TaxID=1080225 RepID=A0A2T0MG80_9FLAO|nr:hypothetical protein [Allomuricauda pacifica]PRX56569.1 hypothetical protein CLV81_0566 [Allomuricauda pacifica]
MKIKRKRPALFPNHGNDKVALVIPVKPHQVKLGANFKVGNPANAAYLFLWNSLKQKINYLHKSDLPSNHMVDQVVTITGILKRKNNTYTAILERKDKNEFYKGLQKIYADIDNAVVARELISL